MKKTRPRIGRCFFFLSASLLHSMPQSLHLFMYVLDTMGHNNSEWKQKNKKMGEKNRATQKYITTICEQHEIDEVFVRFSMKWRKNRTQEKKKIYPPNRNGIEPTTASSSSSFALCNKCNRNRSENRMWCNSLCERTINDEKIL